MILMGKNKKQEEQDESYTKLVLHKKRETDRVVALAGNPNVGKSTVFNALTGLKQHTGNWPGKTVANAQGYYERDGQGYVLVDLPGCYSLMAHSAEEEVARNFILFEKPDAVIVVCDAACLERNLNLVLQTMEITSHVIVCVNLMDEAKKKQIEVDLHAVSQMLGVPVIGTTARSRLGLDDLMTAVEQQLQQTPVPYQLHYPDFLEEAITELEPMMANLAGNAVNHRWLAIKLLEHDCELLQAIEQALQIKLKSNLAIVRKLSTIYARWEDNFINKQEVKDAIVSTIVKAAESIGATAVTYHNQSYDKQDRAIDRLLTSKWTGFPVMFLVLLAIFWLTITGANYPSQLISSGLFWFEEHLFNILNWLAIPAVISNMLVLGIYRVLAWVISVMLPPMAIFFPLFTLLEDVGYLPRVAFNLDRMYKKCSACGKQALTMCMGFGCNAAGVIGCRIIDSPRERLIAIITNNFVPCNGRFPTIIAILSMFFVGTIGGLQGSLSSSLLLTCVILLGIFMTFLVSKLLSMTILKGVPSSFTLEMPPYRKPQIGQVIVRSIFDRTLFVLGRAIVIAAPAGLVIWMLANISIGNITLLAHCSNFLDPFAQLFGMDGVILLAFILGIPANEIVIPIMIMAYMAKGNLLEIDDLSVLRQLLIDNGWTWITAISVILFSLMHWPCSTTSLTIQKETGSWKWTVISFIIPTLIGLVVCFLFTAIARIVIV